MKIIVNHKEGVIEIKSGKKTVFSASVSKDKLKKNLKKKHIFNFLVDDNTFSVEEILNEK